MTAAYGTWVARPARPTRLAAGGDGSQLAQRVRPVLGEHPLVGKSPEGSRQLAGETRTWCRHLGYRLVADTLSGWPCGCTAAARPLVPLYSPTRRLNVY